jgi:hypothetical protein
MQFVNFLEARQDIAIVADQQQRRVGLMAAFANER